MERTPPVTLNLIIINILVLITLFLLDDKFDSLKHYFMLYKSDLILARPYDALFKPVQIVTYMFNHGGIFHILFNMLALYSIGSAVESVMGSARFLQVYLFSGVFAGIIVALFDPSEYPVVGASGAISGLLVMFAIFFPKSKLTIFPIPISFEAKNVAIAVAVISAILIMFPFGSGGISHMGHLAGMAGAILFYSFERIFRK